MAKSMGERTDKCTRRGQSIAIPYQHTLPCGPSWRDSGTSSSPMSISLWKLAFRSGLSQKSRKKRQAKILLLKFRSTPIALAALPADFSSSFIFQFSIKNLSFRWGLSQKSRKKTSSENTFPQLCQFSFLKPIIPLRSVPKKSQKRQAKPHFLIIQSTPIALAALPSVLSSSSVSPLCQCSFGKPMIF